MQYVKKYTSTLLLILLATIINITLYSQHGAASDLSLEYVLSVPRYNHQLAQHKINELPITITSDNVTGNYPDNIMFTGNVNISLGNSHLLADEVYLHLNKLNGTVETVRKVDALGRVHYINDLIILKGQKAWSNLNTKDINVWEGSYQLVGRQGRGKANLIKLRSKNRYTILKKGSFTSCLPDSDAWSIVGSKVIYDHEELVAKIWNARFNLGSVPIFYIPYLQLPVGDKRHSGFLFPNIKFSDIDYLEFYIPYYLNIAPNMDVTITPHHIHKHGNIMWENEFRYLTPLGLGLMELCYLPSDKAFEKDKYQVKRNHHRWLYCWQHLGIVDLFWRLNINYTKVSDSYYFNDFSSKYCPSTNCYATLMFSIGYSKQNFYGTISILLFQPFSGNKIGIYSAVPQVDFSRYQNNVGPFNIGIYGQVVNFVNTNSNTLEMTRFHLEPSINLPWSNNWASMDAEVKLMATRYLQKNINNDKINNEVIIKGSKNRVIPQFKVDEKLTFERDMNLANGYTQTLESRIQYLYIPYHDQSKINNYDSLLLQLDYDSLFRDRTYSGLDRVASTNKITTGITSRILDKNAIERLNASIGQIYYFSKPRTGDNNTTWDNNNKVGSIVWAGDTYWHISNRWGLRGDIQYDTRLDSVMTSSASAEYRRDEDRMVQLTYRYTSPEYVKIMLPGYALLAQYNQGIFLIGGVASWPIADCFSVVGAYYLDSNTNKAANLKLGLQYNNCCYVIRVGYERKINGWNTDRHESKYDNSISFNIELRGLSSKHNLGTQQMLRLNVLPYHSIL